MASNIKIINDSKTGPLHIMKVWEESKEMKVAASSYKKEGGQTLRTQRIVKKKVHESFCLMPGEISPELPNAAANADQIVGLHQAKLIRVIPVV